MEIASQVARSKLESEAEAKATYKRLLTKRRTEGETAPEREVQQVLAAISTRSSSKG